MEEQAGLVCKCANYPASYIGETKRPRAKRLMEHRHLISPLREHMTEESHRFNLEDVAVSSGEVPWKRLVSAWRLAEAASPRIAHHWTGTLRGWHTLPAIYSQPWSSCDTSDLSDDQESCDTSDLSDNTYHMTLVRPLWSHVTTRKLASVCWRRPDVRCRSKATNFRRLYAGVNV